MSEVIKEISDSSTVGLEGMDKVQALIKQHSQTPEPIEGDVEDTTKETANELLQEDEGQEVDENTVEENEQESEEEVDGELDIKSWIGENQETAAAIAEALIESNPDIAKKAGVASMQKRINELTKQKKEAVERAEMLEATSNTDIAKYTSPLLNAKDENQLDQAVKAATSQIELIEKSFRKTPKVKRFENEETGEIEEKKYFEVEGELYPEEILDGEINRLKQIIGQAPAVKKVFSLRNEIETQLQDERFSYLENEDDARTVKYKEIIKDPDIAPFLKLNPKLKLYLAHAASDMTPAVKKLKLPTVKKVESKAPKVSSPSSSKGSRDMPSTKKIQQLRESFSKSKGTMKDAELTIARLLST